MVQDSGYRREAGDVTWEGAVNARLVTGATYRMGRREWLTAAGWRQLRSAGVTKVLDLRNPGEIRRRAADPQLVPAALEGVEIINLPLESPGNARFETVAVPYMNHPSMYRLVCEEFGEQLRAVFTELARDETGVVVHCSAGRDRSGLIATLLLDLAGRGDLVLEHDALGTRGINEWHRVSGYPHPHESYQDPAALEPVIAARARALERFMDWLGDAHGYLRSIGVAEGALRTLGGTIPTGRG